MLDREGAVAALGIDMESYAALLELMRKELGEWTDFFTAAVGGNPDTLRAKAHRLKSDAANVGALCVSQAASRLEQCIRDQAGDAVIESRRSRLVKA